MYTRIRIEAAAQDTQQVSADLWEMVWLIAYALAGKDQPAPNPFIHEEVISRLDDTESTDAQVYHGRIVVGYPVDWDHARTAFDVFAVGRGKVPGRDYPHLGLRSPFMEDELRQRWDEEAKAITDTDPSECDHPPEAVRWNPYNDAVQCHRCGARMEFSPVS